MKIKTYIGLIVCLILYFSCTNTKNDQVKGYRYIQVEAKPWVRGNPDIEWQFFDTKIIGNIHNYDPVESLSLNKYGSITTEKRESTGFFRVEKIGDRWWVIDPDGNKNIQTVINSLRPGGSERNKQVFNDKFGDMAKWMEVTA